MPKFPDILLNNNPDAPSLDLNNLQVKGVGIFADATERDALNSNLHTEGYLAIMKDTDTPFIYTGGTWTDAANWAEVKGLWDEDGLGIKYTTTGGSVAILDSTRPYQGNIITGLFGSSQSAPGGSRASRKLLHLHEGQLIFSTETNTAVSHIEMSNQTHSSSVGGAIGTSPYNMRIHGYHALEFTHGPVFDGAFQIVYMDQPVNAANVGTIEVGRVGSALGGINLPSFGPATVNTTNYSISMGGRIIFKNHSSVSWDAITQGPGTYHAAGVSLSSPRSSNILTAVSSDSNTDGSYGYVGINSYSPSAAGPAFEVSSSYAKFNNGLHIGDITATGYAFPPATGTTGQILKVDANGDLVFGDDLNGLWTSDTNGITYAGHVGVDIASDVNYPLTVGGGAKIGGKLEMYSNAAQTTGNILITHGSQNANPSSTAANILIGGLVTSTVDNSIIIGYNVTGSGQDLVIGSSTYHSRAVIGSNPGSIGGGSVGIYKATAASYAVAIGQSSNANANGGVAIGLEAMSGDGVAIGNRAGRANTTTNTGNINIGVNAGHRYYNPGGQDFNNTVNIGYEAGRSMAYNTSITGNSVNIGYQTGYFAEGGNNVMIGYRAGYGVSGTSTGSGNVFLGNAAGFSETGSNKLYISNSGTTTPLIYGEFDNNLCRVNGNFQRVVFGGIETTTSGTIHIRDNTNWATQADATDNTASTGLLGIALGATANVGLVLFGDVDYTITGNVGTPVYLDTTAGGFTTTAPTGSGNIVRVMGHIIGSNKIFFNPSNDWLEIV